MYCGVAGGTRDKFGMRREEWNKKEFMEKCVIAAVADNGAIGKGNALLWHIPGDMKYFRTVTTGSPVIMGRKTFESIGRPLPKRKNIVVSRSDIVIDGVETASSMEEALALAEGPLTSLAGGLPETSLLSAGSDSPLAEKPSRAFIIGGGEIYRQAMALADRLYITEVHCTVDDADTFFPDISPGVWKEESRSGRMQDEASGLEFEFVVYCRK